MRPIFRCRQLLVLVLCVLLAGVYAQSSYGITWCWDYVYWVVDGQKVNPNRNNAVSLRLELGKRGYKRVLEIRAKTGPGQPVNPLPQDIELEFRRVGSFEGATRLKKSDVLIFGESHTGIVRDSTGRFDHFLQIPNINSQGTAYTPAQAAMLDNWFVAGRSWTLGQLFALSRDTPAVHDDWTDWLGSLIRQKVVRQYPFLPLPAQVWRRTNVLPGIVSWWDAENDARDSADGNHGAGQGAVLYPDGRIGSAFGLNGSSWIRVPSAGNLRLSAGDFTVAAWVNLRTVCADTCDQDIVSKMTVAAVPNTDGWRLLKQGDGHFWFCFGGSASGTNGCAGGLTTTVRSRATAVPGRWFHVAGVKSGNTISIFVNGALNGSSTMPSFRDTHRAPVTIGAYAGVKGRESGQLNGLIDEAQIYRRALSAAEILTLFRDD